MKRRQAVFLVALGAAAVAALLVPEAESEVDILVLLLGVGVAAAITTEFGGPYLFLCLSEAFAVGVGTASLVLGVLFQPAIACMLCDDDRTSLVVGGSTTLLAAVGVLVYRQPIFLILALLAASTCVAVGLIGFDAWMRRRLSAGDVS
jgi:hypothetical protein